MCLRGDKDESTNKKRLGEMAKMCSRRPNGRVRRKGNDKDMKAKGHFQCFVWVHI